MNPVPSNWLAPATSEPLMWRPDELEQFTHTPARAYPEIIWSAKQKAELRTEIDRLMERQESALAKWQKERLKSCQGTLSA